MISVNNETTSFDLRGLQFNDGIEINITLQAVNDVGTSNRSNTVRYNIPLRKSLLQMVQ